MKFLAIFAAVAATAVQAATLTFDDILVTNDDNCGHATLSSYQGFALAGVTITNYTSTATCHAHSSGAGDPFNWASTVPNAAACSPSCNFNRAGECFGVMSFTVGSPVFRRALEGSTITITVVGHSNTGVKKATKVVNYGDHMPATVSLGKDFKKINSLDISGTATLITSSGTIQRDAEMFIDTIKYNRGPKDC